MVWKPEHKTGIPIYRQIMNWMVKQIEHGHWPAEMKLPTQRKLAEQLQVNRSTVIQALEELKADGLLTGKAGSGIYVSQPGWHELIHGAIPRWKERINQSLCQANSQTIQLINDFEKRTDILRLGTGELGPELIPSGALQGTMRQVAITERDFGYSEPKGHIQLRNALTDYLKTRGIQANAEQIVIVSGGIQALQLLSIGLNSGQLNMFHNSPSYLHSIPSITSTSITSLDKMKLKSNQSFYYVIPTLNNPTGISLSAVERQELIKACAAVNLPIIEDDVYRDLAFEKPPLPLKSLDHNGQVIYIGSLSKTVSPGLRIGWMVGPESVMDHLADLKMQLDYGSSAIPQLVAAEWFRSGLYEQHVSALKKQLKQRADFTEALLNTYFSDFAEWQSPQGGFYIWLRIKQPIVTKALFQLLLKQNILINPGYLYAPNDYEHIRISYSYCSREELARGLKKLAQELKARLGGINNEH